MTKQLKLLGAVRISGTAVVETGLMIGGTDTFGIGGIDKQVVKDPLRQSRPYIPGSSLKGKMRSLLELEQGIQIVEKKVKGKTQREAGPCKCGTKECPICVVFGPGDAAKNPGIGPTRLVVRDAALKVCETPPNEAFRFFQTTGRWVDIKTENAINRAEGTAQNPRTFERVPAGMEFLVEMVYRVFDVDDGDGGPDGGKRDLDNLAQVEHGLELVQQDYLGASGSRGYGRVTFKDFRLTAPDDIKLEEPVWFPSKAASAE